MANTYPQPTAVSEVEEELVFTDVLISSLDPGSEDYQTDRAELDHKKAHLESLLREMQNSASSRRLSPGQRQNQPGTDEVGEAYRASDQWWQAAMNGRPQSTHSRASSTSGSSHTSGRPDDMPGNRVKRPRPYSSYLDVNEPLSKRHTPEPMHNREVSVGSSREPSNHQVTENARSRQMAAETAAQRRRDMALTDAALAQELNKRSHVPSSSMASSSRPNFQTTLNYDGTYQRPPSLATAGPHPGTQLRTSSPLEGGGEYPRNRSYATPSPAKVESGSPMHQNLPSRSRGLAQVVDLTGDDEDEEEISEIAPNSFTPSHRPPMATGNSSGYGYGPPRPPHTAASFTQIQNLMLQMPGAFPGSNGYGQYSSYGNGNMNGGMMRNSYSAENFNGFGNTVPTYSGPHAEFQDLIFGSSSSRPFDIDSEDEEYDDDDDGDIIFGGTRHIARYGNYAGNEDLYQSRYNALAAYDSTKTREEIQALLENIRPDEEMPEHLRVQTPGDLSVKLHKYQELGLTWLKKCEEGSNSGGILADDMGLGKTIQMLALMVTRKSEDPRCKTTLIVAPVALMRQWAQEIRSKLKPGRSQLTVFTHHGSKKAKDFNELRNYDVVLTTYGSIASELKKLEKFRLRQARDSGARPYPHEKCLFLDPNSQWYRVVLDEAQCIKNRNTQAAKGACLLKTKYRFCVTGTPMMNNVEEFYSLIHFLQIKPYCQWEKFRLDINQPLRSHNEKTRNKAMQMLQAVCKAVMLRRTKKSHFEGKPILVLPERTTTVDNSVFSKDEHDFYKALETQTQLQFNKYLKRGTVGKQYSAILVLLLRLRQACCHPHLIRDFGVGAAANLQQDQLEDFARQLAPAVVARIKEANGNFECPVCYDVTPNPAIFVPCGHDTCSECFARIADPANGISRGEEGVGVRCPNCRGQIDPKRLTDFKSFKIVHMPEVLTDAEREGLEEGDSDEVGDDSSTDSDEEDEEGEEEDKTLGGFVVGDDEEDENPESDDGDDDREVHVKTQTVKQENDADGLFNQIEGSGTGKNKKGKAKAEDPKKKRKANKKGKGKAKKAKSSITLAELKKLAMRNKHHKRAYMRRLRKNYVGSAKIDTTMEILDEIMKVKDGEKVLIFSQWTSLLDLLEIPIDQAGYGYRRYDGSMTATMRGDAVDDFRDDSKNVRIMLISLKAGNAGLNLNMASQVIILDPFWNPYIEEQAIDRAHRFGQMRPVQVHRVLIQETVEDRIIALQEKKRALISEALDEKQANALSRLGVQELAYLFGVTHHPSQQINYVPQNSR